MPFSGCQVRSTSASFALLSVLCHLCAIIVTLISQKMLNRLHMISIQRSCAYDEELVVPIQHHADCPRNTSGRLGCSFQRLYASSIPLGDRSGGSGARRLWCARRPTVASALMSDHMTSRAKESLSKRKLLQMPDIVRLFDRIAPMRSECREPWKHRSS